MLQNAYFLAKIGNDTAENEEHFAEILPIGLVGEARGRRAFQILDTKKQGHMSRDEMDTVRCLNHCFVSAPLSYRVSFTA